MNSAVDPAIQASLGPSEVAGRKQSNVSGHGGADRRKMSNVSDNPQLNALFSKADTSAEASKNRIRFTKDDLLARFKQTKELDMTVFEADRILDYAELFLSTGDKPKFSSTKKQEEADPFDDMMAEAAEESKQDEAPGGMLPESVKRTQAKPDCPLQQNVGGPY